MIPVIDLAKSILVLHDFAGFILMASVTIKIDDVIFFFKFIVCFTFVVCLVDLEQYRFVNFIGGWLIIRRVGIVLQIEGCSLLFAEIRVLVLRVTWVPAIVTTKVATGRLVTKTH